MRRLLAAVSLLTLAAAGCQPARPPHSEITVAPVTRPDPDNRAAADREVTITRGVTRNGDDGTGPAGSDRDEPLLRPGQACRVHFRRDAMGVSAPAPLGVDANITSRAAQIRGTIDRVTDQWLVLRVEGKQCWVPRGVILMVELEGNP